MVSDWQGGDISKLFPALSGKEDLSMGEDCRGRHLRQGGAVRLECTQWDMKTDRTDTEVLQYGRNQRRKENLFSRHLLPLI